MKQFKRRKTNKKFRSNKNMAKINIYFDELKPETQAELYEELKEELKEEIEETKKFNPQLSPETVEAKVIDDYINTHNFANEFII